MILYNLSRYNVIVSICFWSLSTLTTGSPQKGLMSMNIISIFERERWEEGASPLPLSSPEVVRFPADVTGWRGAMDKVNTEQPSEIKPCY